MELALRSEATNGSRDRDAGRNRLIIGPVISILARLPLADWSTPTEADWSTPTECGVPAASTEKRIAHHLMSGGA